MANDWKPTRELTPSLRGGWVMRVRGRGDLGRIEIVTLNGSSVYRCIGRHGVELGDVRTLTGAAQRLWAQTP
ncbi:hypothetical protein [Subtercola sp. RTI3]|uniref:hypothetical protein n=1 Tax=Subtercola sp. RTI3 TaxID=3048639 RepID=UPI002B232815|nr:hypothetical protein [Subtercola sp. RTI3]MEA9986094.1 hypothetical protein [Subtercola sp. RTI3]